MDNDEPLLRWFDSEHLKDPLKGLMRTYESMARAVVAQIPPSAERTLALRDLIASKDNAVRGLVDALKKEGGL